MDRSELKMCLPKQEELHFVPDFYKTKNILMDLFERAVWDGTIQDRELVQEIEQYSQKVDLLMREVNHHVQNGWRCQLLLLKSTDLEAGRGIQFHEQQSNEKKQQARKITRQMEKKLESVFIYQA